MTYRVSLFFTEVATELAAEDFLGFLPGSVAEGIRLKIRLDEQQGARVEEEQEKRTKVLFVTGPRAAGRLGLVSSLNGRKDGLGRLMSRVKFPHPNRIAPQRNPERYTL